MDSTRPKQGYFIIASTLSKKRERIQIPCNSNHLSAEPSILLGKTSIIERVLCSQPSTTPFFENHVLVMELWAGQLYREASQVRAMKCCPWLGLGYVHVLRCMCYSSEHSHWSVRLGAHGLTCYLCGFLFYMGKGRYGRRQCDSGENECLGAEENGSASDCWHIMSLNKVFWTLSSLFIK